jgi:hypothetical protein
MLKSPRNYPPLSILFFLLVALVSCTEKEAKKENINIQQPLFEDQYKAYENGDIIFHVSTSNLSKAIQLATRSKYSHVGIIFFRNKVPYVFEASNVVKATPLLAFINKGVDKHFVLKRLKDKQANFDEKSASAQADLEKYLNKPYDNYFNWSNEAIYCSELVWKVYKDVYNIELCPLKELRDFDLSPEAVQEKVEERYGEAIPLEEKVVAPIDIFDSNLLEDIIIEK